MCVCVQRDVKPRGEDMLLPTSTAHRACDRQPVILTTPHTNTHIHTQAHTDGIKI